MEFRTRRLENAIEKVLPLVGWDTLFETSTVSAGARRNHGAPSGFRGCQSEAESNPERKRWTAVRVAPGPELMQVKVHAYVRSAPSELSPGSAKHDCKLRYRLPMIGWRLGW